MTRLEAIDALLTKVKAGAFDPTYPDNPTWKFIKFCDAFDDAFGIGNRHLERFWGAYKGSTDAAFDLLKAVLPGAEYGVANIGSLPGKFDAGIWLHCREYEVNADTPARALLIAILEALKAQEIANAD